MLQLTLCCPWYHPSEATSAHRERTPPFVAQDLPEEGSGMSKKAEPRNGRWMTHCTHHGALWAIRLSFAIQNLFQKIMQTCLSFMFYYVLLCFTIFLLCFTMFYYVFTKFLLSFYSVFTMFYYVFTMFYHVFYHVLPCCTMFFTMFFTMFYCIDW